MIGTDDLVRHRNGMWINPGRWSKADHSIITEIFEDNFYTLDTIKTAPVTILDIGGHIGAFAVACHQRWPNAQIVCVEPNPMLWVALSANTQPWAKELIWAGIGKATTLYFRNSMTSEGSGGRCTASSTTIKTQQDGDPILPVVPCLSLDAVFKRIGGAPDLLKLDCEGCERDILEHWPNLFLQCAHIRMEWHDPDTKHLALQVLGESSRVDMEWDVSLSHERDCCGILAATKIVKKVDIQLSTERTNE